MIHIHKLLADKMYVLAAIIGVVAGSIASYMGDPRSAYN